MAAKAKDKKEKGKKGKHKTEKARLEMATEIAVPSLVDTPYPAIAPVMAARSRNAEADATASTSDAILDAVLECVASGGIEGLTTRRIAAQAGVNEVTIFRRFGNKDALLDAVFAREAARMKAGAVHYSGNLEEDLVAIVTVFTDALVRRAGVLPILIEAMQQHPEVKRSAQHSLAAFTDVAGVLERHMREGRLQNEPPQRALMALVGPLVFGSLLARAADRELVIDVQQHVHAYLYGRSAIPRSAR